MSSLDPLLGGKPERLDLRLGFQIAALAIASGLIGDLLFNGAGLDVNLPIWLGLLDAGFLLIARRMGLALGHGRVACLAVSLAFSTMIALRDSPSLQVFLLLASWSFLVLGIASAPDTRFRSLSLTAFFWSLALGVVQVAAGLYRLSVRLPWHRQLDEKALGNARSVGRALLLAAPLLLVFGALFAAADAVFQEALEQPLSLDRSAILRHLAWFFAAFRLSGGLLWCGLVVAKPVPTAVEPSDDRRLKTIETAIILGSLALLFAIFVAVQLGYLFGGEERVPHSIDLTYAEYARRGFFELVAAAALLLPVQLLVNWARRLERSPRIVFTVLGSLLLLLLFVVMASALERLRIYVDAFGLTETRLYVVLALLWLAAVSSWLLWSLVSLRLAHFLPGALTAAVAVLVFTTVLNPDAFILKTNLDRAAEGERFDTDHALSMSADAVPTLIEGVADLAAADACTVARGLLAKWGDQSSSSRSWNWGRSSAIGAVDQHRDQLELYCE